MLPYPNPNNERSGQKTASNIFILVIDPAPLCTALGTSISPHHDAASPDTAACRRVFLSRCGFHYRINQPNDFIALPLRPHQMSLNGSCYKSIGIPLLKRSQSWTIITVIRYSPPLSNRNLEIQ